MEHTVIGHPFYFPTQVVLLDDDPDFLDGISLMLDKNLSFKLFQSAKAALEHVNRAHTHVQLLQRCYSNYKTGPLESDSLSHTDIGKIHLEILNGARFQTASTVVVDYSMPEMNGLEFLMSLKNPFVKKVLLTGQADMELAIKAFNKQLIDQFIDKHDPKLRQKLNSTISNFSDQYFRSSFKLLTDPIIANNHDGFLVNGSFQDFFADLRAKMNCVEYYMIDSPHSGFLMVDAAGGRRCLLVYTEEAVQSHYQALLDMDAPPALLGKVRTAELLPGFDLLEENGGTSHEKVSNWESCYFPGIKIESRNNLYVTLVSDTVLKDIQGQSIIPYSAFLEANSMHSEILH